MKFVGLGRDRIGLGEGGNWMVNRVEDLVVHGDGQDDGDDLSTLAGAMLGVGK